MHVFYACCEVVVGVRAVDRSRYAGGTCSHECVVGKEQTACKEEKGKGKKEKRLMPSEQHTCRRHDTSAS